MDGYRDLGITIHALGGIEDGDPDVDVQVDVTLEVSNDDDTNPATRQWIDVTAAGYRLDIDSTIGAGNTIQSVGNTAVNAQADWDELNVRRYRFKVVFSLGDPDSTNGEISIWTRRDAL